MIHYACETMIHDCSSSSSSSSITGSVTHSKRINIFRDKVLRRCLVFLPYNAKGKVLNDVIICSAVAALFTSSPGNRPLTDSCSRSKYTSRYVASHGHGEMIHAPCACPWTQKAQAGLSSSLTPGG